MRPQKVEHQAIMEGLLEVFRAKGYDGASLSDLAAASGLKKASLYHRFPGGKQEMTAAVLDYVAQWVEANIFAVLTDINTPPRERLQIALQNIDALYEQGQAICIFRALSTHTGLGLFGQQIESGMKRYIEAFTKLGLALHMDESRAKQAAIQSLIDIQGGLIVSKGIQEVELFGTVLQGIKNRYQG